MSLVTVFADDTVTSPEQCSSNSLYVDHKNGNFTCTSDLIAAVNSVDENENAEIVLLQDKVLGTSPVTITKNLTINLNNHKLTMSATVDLTIKGANVTIRNGNLDLLANHGHIVVDSSDKASTLTVDAKVNANYYASSAIKVNDATNTTVINVRGEWKVVNEIVACNPGKDEKLTINLEADVTGSALQGTHALINLDAGTSVVNVNRGTYTSNDRVFIVKNGTLNVNGGTVKATGTATAIWVQEPDPKYTNALNINGGLVTSSSSVEEAVWFGGSKGTYKITGGTITSGKDKDGKQLPALHIAIEKFLDNHKKMITGGNFTGAIVGNVKVGTDTYRTAKEATADLVGNATLREYLPYLAYSQCH